MSDLFADRLLDAIQKKGSPICVGIDPVYEQLPDAIAGPAADRDHNDPEAAIDAIFSFTTAVLKIVAPHVPVVKFQSAYFEKYLWEGVESYYSLVQEAKDLGLLVIGDVKRGDIGSTSAAYAAAHLADAPEVQELKLRFSGHEAEMRRWVTDPPPAPDRAALKAQLGEVTLALMFLHRNGVIYR